MCSCSVVSDSLWSYGLHVACQAPLSMEFSRQEYCSGLPFPSPTRVRGRLNMHLWYLKCKLLGYEDAYVDAKCLKITFKTMLVWRTSLVVQWLQLCFTNAGGVDSIPGLGTKIPHASQPKKSKHIKQQQYCKKFKKDFKKCSASKYIKIKLHCSALLYHVKPRFLILLDFISQHFFPIHTHSTF